jgi:hypothetical protein
MCRSGALERSEASATEVFISRECAGRGGFVRDQLFRGAVPPSVAFGSFPSGSVSDCVVDHIEPRAVVLLSGHFGCDGTHL